MKSFLNDILLDIYGRSILSQLPTDKIIIKTDKRREIRCFITITTALPAVIPGAQVSINLIFSFHVAPDFILFNQFLPVMSTF